MINVFNTKDGRGCFVLNLLDMEFLSDELIFKEMWDLFEVSGLLSENIGLDKERQIMQFGVGIQLIALKGCINAYEKQTKIIERYLEDMHICHCRYSADLFETEPKLISLDDFTEYIEDNE